MSSKLTVFATLTLIALLLSTGRNHDLTAAAVPSGGVRGEVERLRTTLLPVGAIIPYAGQVANDQLEPLPDWLVCNGEMVSRDVYPALFSAIGDAWSKSNGNPDLFGLPNLRGRFLRGVAFEESEDPGILDRAPNGHGEIKAAGSTQEEDFRNHNHKVTDNGHDHSIDIQDRRGTSHTGKGGGDSGSAKTSNTKTGITLAPSGGKETRPKNAYVHFLIKCR